jgi:hypothetical protein
LHFPENAGGQEQFWNIRSFRLEFFAGSGENEKQGVSMKRRVCLPVIALVIACAFVTTHQAYAQDAGSPGDAPYPVALGVGETFDVCSSGQIVCPARVPICDDPKVAVPVDMPNGLGFKGVAPGTTLCSAASAVGPRRIFRITVR